MKKTRDEINKECDELDQFCNSFDPEKLYKISCKTEQTKFTQEDILKLSDVSEENKHQLVNKEIKYSHKKIKKILLRFKHNFESNADCNNSDDIINTIHDPVCGCMSTWTSRDLKRRLLILKRCLEEICDYHCSDSIIDRYLQK
jgi:hypothetical protein